MEKSVRRAPLTRDRVLSAAVQVADEEGMEALTIRRLADVLGVHPTSLYNHVPSKEAILDGVLEVLFTEVTMPAEDGTWQEWVRGFAFSMRDVARSHPGAFMVLTRRPAETPQANAQALRALDAFRRDGFSTTQAMRAVRGTSLALLGLALNECPPMGGWIQSEVPDPRLAAVSDLAETDDGHWESVVQALTTGLEAGPRRSPRRSTRAT